jgi:hypothetical protein
VNGISLSAPDDADADVIASTSMCTVAVPLLPTSNAPSSIGCTTRVARSL